MVNANYDLCSGCLVLLVTIAIYVLHFTGLSGESCTVLRALTVFTFGRMLLKQKQYSEYNFISI